MQATRTNDMSFLNVDRTALSTAPLFDETDIADYWLSLTPQERLRRIEVLRRINYGHRATERLQRILEIAPRP